SDLALYVRTRALECATAYASSPMPGGSRRARARTAHGVLLACALALAPGCRRQGGPPFSPADSLKTVRIAPGFRIEPFVSEPAVWYLEDTDGDGRAHVRKVVLTGFAFTNPQHTVNGPLYGLDNWVYLAHEGPAEAIVFKDKFGDRGHGVRFPDQSAPPLDVN